MSILLVLATSLSSCGGSGSQRSAEAYCKQFYETATAGAPRQPEVEFSTNPYKEPLRFIMTGLRSPERISTVLSSMVAHAPLKVKADTEAIRARVTREKKLGREKPSRPTGVPQTIERAAAATPESFSRVNDYLIQHCPVNSPLAQDIMVMNAGNKSR
jgi:hypothetical protein